MIELCVLIIEYAHYFTYKISDIHGDIPEKWFNAIRFSNSVNHFANTVCVNFHFINYCIVFVCLILTLLKMAISAIGKLVVYSSDNAAYRISQNLAVHFVRETPA
jgi:hypothetical protein